MGGGLSVDVIERTRRCLVAHRRPHGLATDHALQTELRHQLTCFPVSGPIFAGKFQFSGCVIRAAGRGRTMERSKFTEPQIPFILRQAEDGTVVGEVCRKAGSSEATCYNWRKKYAGFAPSDMS